MKQKIKETKFNSLGTIQYNPSNNTCHLKHHRLKLKQFHEIVNEIILLCYIFVQQCLKTIKKSNGMALHTNLFSFFFFVSLQRKSIWFQLPAVLCMSICVRECRFVWKSFAFVFDVNYNYSVSINTYISTHTHTYICIKITYIEQNI